MALEAIKATTIQDSVHEQLMKAIMEGEIAPGERVTMEGLAKQLNVSIMPVREALRRLEANKFVTIERNKRIIVTGLSKENFEQIFQIRLILETHAAVMAGRNRSDDSIKKLEEAHHRYIQGETIEDQLKANSDFHGIIYREAKLPMLSEIIGSVWDKVVPYFYIDIKESKDWDPYKKDTDKFHEGMLAGMRRKDPEEVKKWLIKDITQAANRIMGELDRRKNDDPRKFENKF